MDGGTTIGQVCGKDSSLYYAVEVPAGTSRMIATLNGEPVGTSNDCDLYAKLANFPTKASYGAKGVENLAARTEILTVSNPAAGTWYFLLYGTTSYTSNVTLTVNCYTVEDIVLTAVPQNDLVVPFTAAFKGQVLDGSKTGIPNIVVQVRNPITGLTTSLTKTDTKGYFSYSATVNAEGDHTFDFFFADMPDTSKGTASHTVATRAGCMIYDVNVPGAAQFDFSYYLPAIPIELKDHDGLLANDYRSGLQNFLNIRNGWTDADDSAYVAMWPEYTIAKARDDTQIVNKLESGLYMLFYGVGGAGVGNDMTTISAFSAVPYMVHVPPDEKDTVLDNLRSLNIIDDKQLDDIKNQGKIGVVAVTAVSNPGEGAEQGDRTIALIAREQLYLLSTIAQGNGIPFTDGEKYSDVLTKKATVTLPVSNRKINVVTSAFVK
ncbi:MAG: carboxypeptidase-like regulatory domain-containing protein [Victivallales bacterium]